MDIQQRIQEIEKEIRETPYHKGTEHHIGRLRARVAKLQDELIIRESKKGGGGGFAIKKAGDATVVLVGPPSVGKSTLLNKLTNAKSPVAPYEFTTVSVIPGIMSYQGAMIQILDIPGLIEGASTGRGRGRQVLSVARAADLLLLITEVGKEKLFEDIKRELYLAGVRVNQNPPQVKVGKKIKGGIILHMAVNQSLSGETIKEILGEFGLSNAEITLKEKVDVERLLDAFSHNRVFIPAIFVVNKADLKKTPSRDKFLFSSSQIPAPSDGADEANKKQNGGTKPPAKGVGDVLYISAKTGENLDQLKNKIWGKLRLASVYVAKNGQKPNYNSPIIMRQGETLMDLAKRIGEQFAEKVKGVKISGPGSNFPRQKVSLSYLIQDGMIVTFLH